MAVGGSGPVQGSPARVWQRRGKVPAQMWKVWPSPGADVAGWAQSRSDVAAGSPQVERWPSLAGWRGLREPSVAEHFGGTLYSFADDWGTST
jgi:hypothetical protein